jgi:hypothetical protein
MELDFYDRIPSSSSTHISSATSRLTSSTKTNCSPTQSAINRFNEDNNIQDLILYEVEILDKVKPKSTFVDKISHIKVPNVIIFLLVPTIISLILASAILLAIEAIGKLGN